MDKKLDTNPIKYRIEWYACGESQAKVDFIAHFVNTDAALLFALNKASMLLQKPGCAISVTVLNDNQHE
jgi:hypothetical protein